MIRSRLPVYLGWVVALSAALYLRLWQLPQQLLADDEWHAVNKLLSAAGYRDIFTSFGLADHCIPLTLLYAWLANQGWLTEWSMRLPLLMAGMALVIVLPLLVRRWLQGSEYWLFTALLAVSPLLIYFSRTARPYALSTLLATIALFAFYRWWVERKWSWGVLYGVLAPLTVWLQLVTIPLVVAPFLFFGIHALISWRQNRHARDVLQLFVLGVSVLAGLLLLVGPPIFNDIQSLTAKSGVDFMSLATVGAVIKLYAGTSCAWLAAVWMLLMLVGGVVLYRRQPLLMMYLSFCAGIAIVFVALSGGAWLHHPLVPARYLLPVLPLALLCVALGAVACMQWLPGKVQYGVIFLFPLLLFLAGPVPGQYKGINQFTGHMGYQFDYDWRANVYNQKWQHLPTSPFFEQLAKQPPASKTLIMAPWLLEWHYNPWYLQQRVHQQHVVAGFLDGVCGAGFFGEYPAAENRVNFAHVMHIKGAPASKLNADYLVYTLWDSGDGRFAVFDKCLGELNLLYGAPVYRDEQIEVFDLRRESVDES